MPFLKQLTLNENEPKHRRTYGKGLLRRFDKTPPSIVCPHFWQLNWGYGCPFNCAYCYLQGTFRGNKKPWHRRLSQVFLSLEKAFAHGKDGSLEPTIFNSGELTDSLAFPKVMKEIVDKFEEQDIHKLLILTKSNNVGFLVEKLRKQTIYSFSLNANEVARRWEQGTASPESRISAAKELIDAGYEVRVRIDPIFPIDDWKKHYEDILYLLVSELNDVPNRVTLGTPRGLRKTIRFSNELTWTKYFTEDSSWGKKIAFDLRKEIYEFMLDIFQNLGLSSSRIALCKETIQMWEELGWNRDNLRCNCVW